MMRWAIAVALLLPITANGHDSFGSCVAVEQLSVCEALYADEMKPPAATTKVTPGPSVSACTGILSEATAKLRSAILMARHDMPREFKADFDESSALQESAADCRRRAREPSQDEVQEWELAKIELRDQLEIVSAVIEAKKTAGK